MWQRQGVCQDTGESVWFLSFFYKDGHKDPFMDCALNPFSHLNHTPKVSL